METYLIAALCWGIGGVINGVTGFGLALIAMPLFSQYVDLGYAVPAGTLIGLSMNLQMGWTYRRSTDWQRLRPLLIGALPGAIIGATVLSHMPEAGIKMIMGIFLLGYALWSLFFPKVRARAVSPRWGYLAGLCSTAIGTAFGMGGPPTIVYTTLAGWSQEAVKAGIASFFLCAGMVMVVVQLAYGLHSLTSLSYVAVCAPAVALGCRGGILLSRRLAERSYRTMIFLLLVMMALVILYRAVFQL
ncbi:sulfite exporter TauE/SafE family protein [Desulfogranum mediterraneum]|uniref:sulfite exporter TauE/SafE family protein n=1 Tax=Desulfogranum mediterraneum TaxID=160661 RepID=UPI000423EBAE|nr:sulfite exporter TauE/SafE family protein [Desulfogranum mediterraneum]